MLGSRSRRLPLLIILCALAAPALVAPGAASAAYRDTIAATPGLISHWRFGELSGATAFDEQATNNGAYVGSPSLAAAGLLVGDGDKAVNFDGVDDSVKVVNSLSLAPASSLTWEGWIKPASVGCGLYLFTKVYYAASFGCNGDLRFILRPDGVFTDLYSPANSFAAGQIYHLALTWDGATMRIHKNGIEIASKPAAGTLSSSYNLTIGADSGGYDARAPYFPGVMDEVALYSRALSVSEVRQHYAAGIGDTAPPDTTITSGPSGTTQSASESFDFVSSESGSTFECRLDGGAWESCSSPKSYSGLAAGEHTFEARATDPAFNTDPSPASRTWTHAPDTTPPETTITAGPSGATGSPRATFEFAGSEAGATFECRLDAGAWASCTSPKSYSKLTDGEHTFEVRATDGSSNTDQSPAARTWTVEVSRYASEIRGTSGVVGYWRLGETAAGPTVDEVGTNDGIYNGSPQLGTSGLLVADPDPGLGLDGVDDHVKVPDSAPLDASTGFTWESWIAPSSFCGKQLFDRVYYAASFHCSGNIRFMLRPDGVFTDLYSPGALAAGQTYHIALTWDGATMRIYKNGVEWASKAATGTLPDSSYNLIIGAESSGTEARGSYYGGVLDEAALYNRALSGSEVKRHYDLGVDPLPPETTITSAPDASSTSSSASFEFTSSEAASTFECRIDGGTWKLCTSPRAYTSLDDGAHAFEVRATDSIGNVDPSPASRSWSISTTGSAPAAGLPPNTAAELWVPNGRVDATALSGRGSLYLGGSFTRVGPYTGHGVALDESGSAAPARAVNGTVTAVAPDGNGGWYIGGEFTRVGTAARDRLAHISSGGAVDPEWNPGANGTVRAIAVSGSTVYVGGDFTTVAGQGRSRIAAIDSSGSATSWAPGADAPVYSLATSGSTVYVGGQFATIGGQARARLAAVDSAGSVTPWDPGANGLVSAVATSGSLVYAGGSFTTIGGQTRNRIAALDAVGAATSWNPDANASVSALAVTDSAVYAGGGFTIVGGQLRAGVAALDPATGAATSWNANISGGSVNGLAVANSTVYIGGAFSTVGGQQREGLAALAVSGGGVTSWSPNADKTVNAVAAAGSKVYVGGSFASVGGVSRKNLAEIDLGTGRATAWDPAPNNGVSALEADGSTLYVGGSFDTIASQPRSRVAALSADGAATSWNPGANGSVTALEVGGDTVYLAGSFSTVGGQPRTKLAAVGTGGVLRSWNPSPDNLVNGIAVSGATVYAGGDFKSIGGKSRSYLAALDADGNATDWNPSPNQRVTAIAATDSTVYAAGTFTSLDLEPRKGLGAFKASDGSVTSWEPGGPSGGDVLAMRATGAHVFIGGGFTSVGGQARNRMAALDVESGALASWSPSADATVRALAATGGSAYAGGDFRSLGSAGAERPHLAGFLVAPSNASPPTLDSPPRVGQGAMTSTGDWHDAASYSYEWLRDGELLAGQTAPSYTPTAADTARPLASRVTATNLAGSAAADGVAQLVEGPPINDSLPTVSGTAQTGKVLSAADGAWRARPDAAVQRQWRRCDTDGATCTDVAGATGPTYKLLHADTGKTLRFSVTQTNVHGSATAASAPTDTVTPTDLPVVTLAHSPALADGWVSSYADALTVSATDNAPGVAKLEVAVGQSQPREFAHACATSAEPCPETLDNTFSLSDADLVDGVNTISAVARDDAGNVSDPEPYTVKLDRVSPTLTTSGALKDAAGGLVGGRDTLALTMSANDGTSGAGRLEVRVDGALAASADQECAAGGCTFERELMVDLGEFGPGAHTIEAIARDQAGNSVEQSWQLTTTDGVEPQITLGGTLAEIDGESIAADQTYSLHAVASDGTAENPQSGVKSVEILLGEERKQLVEAPCQAGNCSLAADYQLDPAQLTTGGHTVRVRAVDESGEVAERTLIVIVHRPPAAPALEETTATPVSASTDFLYTGSDPVQTGVAPGTIDEQRASVIRGRVLTEDGAPLPGVEVTVDGHPEFGSTQSRADGEVYLAVNGGGTLTLRFKRDGADPYMPADRTIEVPWQGYAQFDDVRLLKADPDAEAVDLSGAAVAMQSVAGPTASDGNGARRPVLMFEPGTYGRAHKADGTSVALGLSHIRLTEYTVGDAGPEALPGELPTQTAYTYAAEFSVDEAEAIDAETVRFTDELGAPKPAISYNENFLHFAVGSTVPSGYYDRERAVWVPEDSGRVVKVIGHSGAGAAVLDVKGKGAAATSAELAELGVTDEELARLGTLYADGTELWRVALSHLTPYDLNMALYAPPPAADLPPGSPRLAGPGGVDDPNCTSGSIILCETQALGEQVPVTGSPFSLVYQSDRVPGRKSEREVEIPLSDANTDPIVQRIDLTIEIAGRTIRKSFPDDTPSHLFKWDGKDEFGRTVQGAQEAKVTVSHVYPGGFSTPSRFGSPGRTDEVGERRAGRGGERSMSTTSTIVVSNWDATKLGLGGWTLDAHHAYDPVSRILHRGDGGRQSAQSMNRAMRALAGGDPTACAPTAGQPARSVSAGRPEGLDIAPDGSLYFASGTNRSVWKVTPDGIIRHVAGVVDCPPYTVPPYSGEGGPATEAQLARPNDVAVDSRGGVYIADELGNRILYVDSAGTIRTVAGNGTAGFSGDGGPATDAQLNRPFSVEIAPDGTLYVSDRTNGRIRQVTTDGRIDTFAGRPGGVVWENARATRSDLGAPAGIALGADGSLYVTGSSRVRRISPGDRIKTVVGIPNEKDTPPPSSVPTKLYDSRANGMRADEVQIHEGSWVAAAPDGSLYVHDYQTVKRIAPDGRVEPGASQVPNSLPYAGFDVPQPAGSARLDCPSGIDVGPGGEVFISDSCAKRVNVVDSGMPRFTGQEIAVPSKDGEEIYKFSDEGRHLQTLDALTAAVTMSFGYDSAGRLTSVTDGDGDITRLERDAAGGPTAIVSADGDRTLLSAGSDGLLARIENPKGEAHRMTYAPGALLSSFTDPRNNASSFQYDSLGRLERDDDAAGGFKTLTRTGNRETFDVTVRTRLGRETKHHIEPSGGGTLRKKTDPAGLVTTTAEGADGQTTVTEPDGTVGTSKTEADPRFGTQSAYVSRAEVRTPSARSRVATTSRTTTGAPLGDPMGYTKFTEATTANGRTWTSVFDRATRTFTSTSPAARTSTTTVDAQRRPVSSSAPGIAGTTYSYDMRGRPSGSAQGTRTTGVTYDVSGNVDTETDSLGRTTSYDHDAAGRVTQVTLPGGRVVGYSYDAAGNLTSVTPPARGAHTFSFGLTGLLSDYDPPDIGATALPTTQYSYDYDRNVTRVDRPDRSAPISFAYDGAGRLESTSAPTGAGGATESTTYGYDAADGHLKTITAPSDEVLTFTDDGPLPLGQTLTGEVAGEVNQSYDAEQRLASETINGAHAVSYGYDADDVLSSVGALAITRDPVVDGVAQKNGLVASTTLGTISESRTYNGFGEPATRTFAVGTQPPLFESTVTRDNGGRIETRSETAAAGATGWGYVYDTAGRLSDATKTAPDGASTATHYDYDGNGNRTQRTRGGETTYYTYDEQDRLTRAGTVDLTYDANGQLTRRQDSANATDDTRYGYDAYGQLREVTLPDGRSLRYVIDGAGRRVGKKVGGQLIEGSLYSGDQLIAELNPDNTVKTRFVYATRSHVPDYMVRGGVTYRLVTDELGSPRLVVNSATGEVVQELAYDEFGIVTADTNPGFQPFGYAGGLYDRDTELVHFGAREYSAELGRWTSKDPIGFAGGDTNLYGYVFSDPINLIDPTGLYSWSDFKDDAVGTLAEVDDVITNGDSREFLGNEIVGFTNALTLGQSNRLLGIDGACTGLAGSIGGVLGNVALGGFAARGVGFVGQQIATRTQWGNKLFGRIRPGGAGTGPAGSAPTKGRLNNGNIRIGMGYRFRKGKGQDVFRIGWGTPGQKRHGHFDFLKGPR